MGRMVLQGVTKSFGDVNVIPPLDLEIDEGEFVVFVGPSGCGKSTLLRLIAGLEDVTSGRIEIDGVDATTVPPAKRGLAMVFQSYALYPHMTVRKNIAFPLRMAGLDKDEQDKRVSAAAAVLNLTDYLDRRPGQIPRLPTVVLQVEKQRLLDELASRLAIWPSATARDIFEADIGRSAAFDLARGSAKEILQAALAHTA